MSRHAAIDADTGINTLLATHQYHDDITSFDITTVYMIIGVITATLAFIYYIVDYTFYTYARPPLAAAIPRAADSRCHG